MLVLEKHQQHALDVSGDINYTGELRKNGVIVGTTGPPGHQVQLVQQVLPVQMEQMVQMVQQVLKVQLVRQVLPVQMEQQAQMVQMVQTSSRSYWCR